MRKFLILLAALLTFGVPAEALCKHHKPPKKPVPAVPPQVWDIGTAPRDLYPPHMRTAFPATTSTINPAVPAANSSLLSAPIRANFAAAYSDINNIYTQLSTPTNFLSAGTGIAITSTGTVSLAPIASETMWANPTGSAAVPAATTLTAFLDSSFSPSAGSLIARGASVWASLAPGASGLPLVSNGTGVVPSYQALPISAGGSTVFAASAASGGSANAQTFASGNPSTWTLTAGNVACGVLGYSNTGATTLAVNGTTATAVRMRNTSGLNVLIGGELAAGQSQCFQYDGTYYEMLLGIRGTVEIKSGNYTASGIDGWGDIYDFTAASPTLTIPQSTTLQTGWAITAFADGGPITVTPYSTDTINGGTAGASVTIPQYSFSTISTDSAGHVYVSGTAIVNGQLAAAAANTLKGNNTGSSAAPSDLTIVQVQNLEGVYSPPQGRLTLTSATPVMTASSSNNTTIYYTQYVGDMVPIYNGTSIQMYNIGGEISEATTDTTYSPAAVAASSCYDQFVWNNSGTIRLSRSPAWTNSTTRSMALSRLTGATGQGLIVNGSAITNGPGQYLGTYLGTFCSNASSSVDFIFGGSASGGSVISFGIWNEYNRRPVVGVSINTATWTYTTATARTSDNSGGAACYFVYGMKEDSAQATFQSTPATAAASGAKVTTGIGYNSTTAFSVAVSNATTAATAAPFSQTNIFATIPAVGQSYFDAMEIGDGTNANNFGVYNTTAYPVLTCTFSM